MTIFAILMRYQVVKMCNACNYNPLATDPPIQFEENDQNPMACSYSDEDGDGVCDIFEVIGCTDYLACNYDATCNY